MGGFEDGGAGVVVDVGSGSDADAADAGSERVGDVVAVEVEGGDDIVFSGAGEELLEEGVGDDILDDEFVGIGFGAAFDGGGVGDFAFAATVAAAGPWVGGFVGLDVDFVPWSAVEGGCVEEVDGGLVGPVAEGSFGELHDVAFVDDGDGGPAVVDGVFDGGLHEALCAFLGDWFDAEAGGVGEADLFEAFGEVLLEVFAELVAVIGALLKLDAGVDIFGVFAEDDHVGIFGVLDG